MKINSIIVSISLTLVSAWTFAQPPGTTDMQHAASERKAQDFNPSAQPQNSTEISQQEQDDRAAATVRSMARAGRGKVTEGISPEAVMVFTHKCNSKYDTQMTLNRVGNLYKLMPRKLKREIGSVYYPVLRDGLHKADSMQFLEADASKHVLEDGSMQIDLSFPKFYLTMEHITWEDLDRLFLTYFKEK